MACSLLQPETSRPASDPRLLPAAFESGWGICSMFGRFAPIVFLLWCLGLVCPVAAIASADADYAARWITDHSDNHGQPFAIVDKRDARLYVFSPEGELVGVTSVLIGLTPGDDAIGDIALRTPASLRPFERTTPAGRYASQPGHNISGEDIVWIDYDASLAIHRLRPAPAAEHRPERIVSSRTDDKRISYGCVVVPVAFYDRLVAPTLGRQRGIVYVLPETRPVEGMLAQAR
jgi:hypothetical protein